MESREKVGLKNEEKYMDKESCDQCMQSEHCLRYSQKPPLKPHNSHTSTHECHTVIDHEKAGIEDDKKLSSHRINANLGNIIGLVGLMLSILGLVINYHIYLESKVSAEESQQLNELLQSISESRQLSFKSNLEFWDYSIDSLLLDMLSENEHSEQLAKISLLIAKKQAQGALNEIYENEDLLEHSSAYYLLISCLTLRDEILGNEYQSSRDTIDVINKVCSAEQESGIDAIPNQILIGILEFYACNYSESVQNLTESIRLYSVDSPFYSVANYWLALLSIRLRHNYCDMTTFLSSTYGDNRILNVMKSSIVFLFDNFSPKSGVFVLGDVIVEAEDGQNYVLSAPHTINNPANFLDKDDSTYIDGLSMWYSQSELFLLYDLLFQYREELYKCNPYHVCPPDNLDDFNKQLVSIIANYPKKDVIFMDPSISIAEFEEEFRFWFGRLSFGFELHQLDGIVPTDVIFDRLVRTAALHSTPERNYAQYAYDYAFEWFNELYSNASETQDKNGTYAVLALNYYRYVDSDTEFDTVGAAKCAYEYGYRYKYVLSTLYDYYNMIGDTFGCNQIQQEMRMLRM